MSRLLEELVRKQVCFRAIGGSDACRVSEEAVLELSFFLSQKLIRCCKDLFLFCLVFVIGRSSTSCCLFGFMARFIPRGARGVR